MDWQSKLDGFGRELLVEMGVSNYDLPTSANPIVEALAKGDFVERYDWIKGFNRAAVSRVATICQMVVFDAIGGPEGDRKPKALRRHWYSYFKTRFAQPFSEQLGEDIQSERWGLNWAARLSTTYAKMVDTQDVTYKDLWVEDASRMMTRFHGSLFSGCNIIIAVEKDSLFGDFTSAAEALGAKTVYSGKGKSSKAAIEKLLREHFSWGRGWNGEADTFSAEQPLIILHISDHDFDGEAVIGPTFAEQARRYTEHVLEARVGIMPEQVNRADWEQKWYQIKLSNSGYVTWAKEQALFLSQCIKCERQWPVVGAKQFETCPACGEFGVETEVTADKTSAPAFGFEVEALRTRDYYSMMVDALLQVLPFDYIIGKLRDECQADAWTAAERIKETIIERNASYQALLEEFIRLEEIKAEFEERVKNSLVELGEPHTEDWRDDPYSEDKDDPSRDDFKNHVEAANGGWAEAWRPFKSHHRTDKLVEHLEMAESWTIQDFVEEVIDWK